MERNCFPLKTGKLDSCTYYIALIYLHSTLLYSLFLDLTEMIVGTKERKLLLNLEKFVVRNAVAKRIPVKAYNKLCKQFIRNPDAILEKLVELDDDSVWEGFQKISNKEATLILFWIELYRRYRDPKVDLKELKYSYSLEHIMPVKWQDHWTFDKIPHPKMSELGEEEAKNDRNRKIYWLGNMFENGMKVWNEVRIEERTQKLFQEFNEIWGV